MNLSLDERVSLFRQRRLNGQDLADTIRDIGHSEFLDHEVIQTELVEVIGHSDPIVRHSAVGALAYHGLFHDWERGIGNRLLVMLLVMVISDEDDDCRRQAASALGSLFRGTARPQVISTLVEVCRDETEADDVRAFAYVALLRVLGVPEGDQLNPINMKMSPIELKKIDSALSARDR